MVGALFIGNWNHEENANKAIKVSIKLGDILFPEKDTFSVIGASSHIISNDVRFFVSVSKSSGSFEFISTVISEDCPERFFWERGCLLRCELVLKLPVYVATEETSGK